MVVSLSMFLSQGCARTGTERYLTRESGPEWKLGTGTANNPDRNGSARNASKPGPERNRTVYRNASQVCRKVVVVRRSSSLCPSACSPGLGLLGSPRLASASLALPAPATTAAALRAPAAEGGRAVVARCRQGERGRCEARQAKQAKAWRASRPQK